MCCKQVSEATGDREISMERGSHKERIEQECVHRCNQVVKKKGEKKEKEREGEIVL